MLPVNSPELYGASGHTIGFLLASCRFDTPELHASRGKLARVDGIGAERGPSILPLGQVIAGLGEWLQRGLVAVDIDGADFERRIRLLTDRDNISLTIVDFQVQRVNDSLVMQRLDLEQLFVVTAKHLEIAIEQCADVITCNDVLKVVEAGDGRYPFVLREAGCVSRLLERETVPDLQSRLARLLQLIHQVLQRSHQERVLHHELELATLQELFG